jgi:hypothetical protein
MTGMRTEYDWRNVFMSGGGYSYNQSTEHYTDGYGNVVEYDEVYSYYIVPNSSIDPQDVIDILNSINSIGGLGPKSPNEDYSQISQSNDPCGVDAWVKFPNRLEAVLYLKDNSNCNKEKFFYITESGAAIVGPWNDATVREVSPRYRDNFHEGWLLIDNVDYHVIEFTHTHPDNHNASDEDRQNADWFGQWGVQFYILFEDHYFRVKPRKHK